ncbi:protein REVEILLE 6 isoform X1 [Vigna umbellata]|uniref:protein REVEILLE 6 isoform X1 n=1 Tax=Phaseolus angularis TaxID=3914 RepID=UPI00080A1194|nr:protein REVEILLE 6 isoform X1 [Vigna angularis]XP_047150512.1 protein REVEILLE 6 isoform X1 [Vigna umbellata]
MVSLNSNPPQTFPFFDPFNMDDLNKKVRKPYTITKSRENWTDHEHDKFLEALHLFDRDWKKIEAFVGSKTVIQIRSHAQKYFMKVQKNGTSEHVPPPRPKRKAAHPYPQKASKNALTISKVTRPLQSSSALSESSFIYRPDSSSVLRTAVSSLPLPSWGYNLPPQVGLLPKATKEHMVLNQKVNPFNYCYSSSNESKQTDQGDQGQPIKAMPDFAQVYSFIGCVFDPNVTNHLQTLQQMDPINVKTQVLLLMRNLSTNLRSPEFENERRMLSLYNANSERAKSSGPSLTDRSESVILSA